ncbi:MAG: universal stress protein [Desulfosarcinaceae bacterium]
MTTPESRKLLVALDGSEQAMAAVEYVAAVFPREHIRIDLFHVSEQLSDLFADMEANPLYKTKTSRLRQWITDQQHKTHHYLESARESLLTAGFPEEQVTTRIQPKKLGVVRDIVKTSYDAYSAVIVGRSGLSRLKDRLLLKNVAFQLVGKVHHLPLVVVGGRPRKRKLCVAFDGSSGSLRGVSWVSHLVGGGDCQIALLSLVSQGGRFWIDDEEFFLRSLSEEAVSQCREKVGPCIQSACDLLVKGGLAPENVSQRIEATDTERAAFIVKWATENGCDTIVLGRRSLVSFLDALFVGRISDRGLNLADKLAVWVI